MDLAIETTKLRKEFGFFKKLVAVDSLDLNIEKGSIHGFIGPNGAGKTTTIKMLTGAISLTKGKARIFGRKAGTTAAKALIGYCPERPSFYDMGALDFLIYNAEICGLSFKEAKLKAEELLKWMGLEKFRDKKANQFSAGMKQKLGLIQALIHNPEILILDEPTANLDPMGRFDVLERIRLLARKQNKTVLISSHILGELEKIVDHVTIINKGKTIIQSDVPSLKKKFASNRFIVDTVNNIKYLKDISTWASVEKIWINAERKIEIVVKNSNKFKVTLFSKFKGKEIEINEFYPLRISLENIFLNVIGGVEDDK